MKIIFIQKEKVKIFMKEICIQIQIEKIIILTIINL